MAKLSLAAAGGPPGGLHRRLLSSGDERVLEKVCVVLALPELISRADGMQREVTAECDGRERPRSVLAEDVLHCSCGTCNTTVDETM